MFHVVCFMLNVAARYGNVRRSCRSFLFFSDALKQFASDDSAGINVTTENINKKTASVSWGLDSNGAAWKIQLSSSWSRHVGLERGTAELRTFSRGSSMRRPQARNGTWSDSWAVTRAFSPPSIPPRSGKTVKWPVLGPLSCDRPHSP